ncbi:MAG TPA: efflux RND transporter permease subunit [Spirochaetota bacterium]|nr:efflux RND transporter permease subunit [Spirochaetota bacterium]
MDNNDFNAESLFDRIIAFSLRRRSTICACAAMLLIAGTVILSGQKIDVLPDLNRPVVTVLAEAHGLAPEEVEKLVTLPIEASLSGSPGVTRVRSVSKRGISIAQVEFDWDTDIYRNRQIVSEKLSVIQNDLPRGVQPGIGPVSSIMGEIQLIGITSNNGSTGPRELRTVADWTVRKRLLSVPGVSSVIVMGGEAKEYHILIKSEQMGILDISFDQMAESLRGLGGVSSGGFIERAGKEFVIRNIGLLYGQEEIGEAVVGYRAGVPVRLREIADIREGGRVRRGDASVNGKQGVILAVLKQPEASTVKLNREIERTVASLRGALPADVIVDTTLFRQSDFIERSTGNVKEAILLGFIMVTAVLLLFLWSLRSTFISLTAIPLSLVLTIITLRVFGYDVNTMTLGGLSIAIGLLVDDAIVDTENIFRRLRENAALASPKNALKVVFSASSEVRNSIVLATAVVILSFIPLAFIQGVEGRIFRSLVVSFVVSLTASLLVALTVTPVLCSYLLTRIARLKQADSPLVHLLKGLQRRNLESLMKRPKLVMTGVALLFAAACALTPFLGREFLPPFNEGTMTLDVFTAPGTSLERSAEIAGKIEKICLETDGVKKVGRRTGRSEMDEHAEGVNYSEIDVTIDAGRKDIRRSEIIAHLRTRFKEVKDASVTIGQPITHRIDHLISGIKADAAVVIYGDDLEKLIFYAQKAETVLAKVRGVEDLLVETQSFVPEIKVSLQHDRAAKYGIPTGSLVETLEMAFNGETVGYIMEGERKFAVTIKIDAKTRSGIEGMKGMIVKHMPDGMPVRLGMVADVYESEGPSEIKRENGSRRVAVQFNVGGRDLVSTVRDAEERIGKELGLEPGYRFEIGGRYKNQAETARYILLTGLLSLIVIVGLIYWQFRSVQLTAQVLVNIPLSFIGGIIALAATGTTLSVASLLGFIAIAGISTRNGIMIVSHYLHLMEHEGERFSEAMVIRGSRERLSPVLMTALSAVMALVPIIATGADAPGKEILYPVSLVLVGGLVSSTLIDIVLTPILFYQLGKRSVIAERYS